MKKLLYLFKKNEKGQAVVELAITIPILLLVLCAIIDFGWIFSNKMFITYSSREGARYATVNATATNAVTLITNKIKNTAPSYLTNKLTVTVTFSNPYDIRSGDVTIKVSCNVKALTPLTGIFVENQDIPIESICVMKIEWVTTFYY